MNILSWFFNTDFHQSKVTFRNKLCKWICEIAKPLLHKSKTISSSFTLSRSASTSIWDTYWNWKGYFWRANLLGDLLEPFYIAEKFVGRCHKRWRWVLPQLSLLAVTTARRPQPPTPNSWARWRSLCHQLQGKYFAVYNLSSLPEQVGSSNVDLHLFCWHYLHLHVKPNLASTWPVRSSHVTLRSTRCSRVALNVDTCPPPTGLLQTILSDLRSLSCNST